MCLSKLCVSQSYEMIGKPKDFFKSYSQGALLLPIVYILSYTYASTKYSYYYLLFKIHLNWIQHTCNEVDRGVHGVDH